ncbi:hypothetical protein STEG23_034880, partial [Scotinomys teguina]
FFILKVHDLSLVLPFCSGHVDILIAKNHPWKILRIRELFEKVKPEVGKISV